MYTPNPKRQIEGKRQWQATLDAAAAERARTSGLETIAETESPQPGQTYLNRRTADFPVEWLVIDAEDERLRVVPLDDHPLVGSRDLALPPTALGGPMVTRCDLDAWLDAGCFESEPRTGVLEPSLLEQVRRKSEAVETDGMAPPKLREAVVDGDPEYHRWRDGTLRRALRALTADPVKVPGPVTVRPVNDNRPGPWKLALIAASLIAAVALPATLYVRHLHVLNVDELEAERARVAELRDRQAQTQARLREEEDLRRTSENEVGRLRTELDETRTTVEDAIESGTRELRDQVADLSRRLSSAFESGTVTNIRRLVIDHRVRTSRRAGDPFPTRALTSFHLGDNSSVIMEVEVIDPEPYSSYRVCMAAEYGDDPLCFDGLVIQDGKWLRLSMPRDRLEADDYLVTVTGFGLGNPKVLEERYDVRIQP